MEEEEEETEETEEEEEDDKILSQKSQFYKVHKSGTRRNFGMRFAAFNSSSRDLFAYEF